MKTIITKHNNNHFNDFFYEYNIQTKGFILKIKVLHNFEIRGLFGSVNRIKKNVCLTKLR
mgnify:CR=1 FL=1